MRRRGRKLTARSGAAGRFPHSISAAALFVIFLVVFVDDEGSHFAVGVIQRFLVRLKRIGDGKIGGFDRGIILSPA